MIVYTYDEIGKIIGLNYNNTQYYYIRNGQNDIVGILDSNLNQVVSYEYDSWGNTISIKDAYGNDITSSSNIGIINPYRYRSYRYDTETGLYYLNSRYYNPEWGRFINADSVVYNNDILGMNMYAYCSNNPTNRVDANGYGWISTVLKNVARLAIETLNNALETALTFVSIGNNLLGMSNSATMLRKSINNNKDALYNQNSNIAKKIQNSATFNNSIDNIANNNKGNPSINVTIPIEFKRSDNFDLFGSLHNATMNITGSLNKNGKGTLSVTITDYYDFKLERYGNSLINKVIMTANNMAWLGQWTGAVNNYNVIIMFNVER